MERRIRMGDKTEHLYEDIINLPHHVSTTRPHMSVYDRAAQFAPFAALTGHDVAIKEKARLTRERLDLDEEAKQLIDASLQRIRRNMDSHPDITLTYFLPDERKEGGEYITLSGKVNKIDEYSHLIFLDNGTTIPIKEIISIEGDL